MINSADPDQLASEEANWSGSTLFTKTGHVVFSKRRVNKKNNIKQPHPFSGALCKQFADAVNHKFYT